MPGPKYGSHDFPRSFGFTGSADRVEGRTLVRSHTRAPQRFAEGGRVAKAGSGPKPTVFSTKTPKTAGTGTPKSGPMPFKPKQAQRRSSTSDILRGNVRRKREQALGLAKGGRVDGASTTARTPPHTQADAETGGKTPLRPGYKKGGKAKAIGGPVKY